jgi:DNA-binding FrmR family transcriptional regulator
VYGESMAIVPTSASNAAALHGDRSVDGDRTLHGHQAATVEKVGYAADKEDLLKRLRRIEGQIRGLQRMVSEDTYCIDVLTQISAATKALQAVALQVLDEHLAHCVAHAVHEGGDVADAKLREASDAIARLVRS